MTELTQAKRDADFIISEAQGKRSRETITIASGNGVIAPGTVLGLKGDGEYAPSTIAVGTGEETAVAINIYGGDTTSASITVAAITDDAEVNVNQLIYAADVDLDAEKITKQTELRAVGIKSR